MNRGVKYRARVTDVSDPKSLGRIRAKLIGGEVGYDLLPWCMPDFPFATNGGGIYWLPEIGDIVHVEQTAEGDWIWTGSVHTANNARPAEGSPTVKVLKTAGGHVLKFDESGSVTIEHTNGSKLDIGSNDIKVQHNNGSVIVLEDGGDIEITSNGDLKLNGEVGQVVTTVHNCAFTGMPHPVGSTKVKAGQ